ncbi:hypothetical protein BC829DRAFT_492221 [Chytridium lagenaria]|nr:hypothetical protein BC829DRAFT_492221 [Chytridium lagenaria]
MGGHSERPVVLIDPAIEKWYHMRENNNTHFKFDRRTLRFSLYAVVLFPAFLYAGSKYYLNTIKPLGSRREDN